MLSYLQIIIRLPLIQPMDFCHVALKADGEPHIVSNGGIGAAHHGGSHHGEHIFQSGFQGLVCAGVNCPIESIILFLGHYIFWYPAIRSRNQQITSFNPKYEQKILLVAFLHHIEKHLDPTAFHLFRLLSCTGSRFHQRAAAQHDKLRDLLHAYFAAGAELSAQDASASMADIPVEHFCLLFIHCRKLLL